MVFGSSISFDNRNDGISRETAVATGENGGRDRKRGGGVG